eukprot:3868-Heterococcus_DN1.PRE.11
MSLFYIQHFSAADSHVREIELSKQQLTALSQARGSVSLTAASDRRRRARQVIFEFVGIKEYLYVAGISRHLRGKYMQFCYNNNTDDQTDKLRTSFTSAVVTGARLQLAFESKLTVSALQADEQRCQADIFSSPSNTRQVLHVARMHGLRWTKTMPAEAALRGQWQLLQWLRMCGCPWDTALILHNAARGGCLQTLRWLKANTRPWTDKTKEDMLWTACCFDEGRVAQWLRNEGAPWPNGFCGRAYLKDEKLEQKSTHTTLCWSPVPITPYASAASYATSRTLLMCAKALSSTVAQCEQSTSKDCNLEIQDTIITAVLIAQCCASHGLHQYCDRS